MGTQTVLIVDDSSGDRLVIRRAFERTRRDVKLIELIDGEELVNYIERKIPFKDVVLYPEPDLILLDINMRRLDGKQALKLLRAKPEYAGVPVVMLTTSSREKDINESYELGGTDYITKPENFKDFMQAIASVCRYLDTDAEDPEDSTGSSDIASQNNGEQQFSAFGPGQMISV